MIRFFRFSPSRLALVYIALSVLRLALFVMPLWNSWRTNMSTFRAYVQGEDTQRPVDFYRQGATGHATAMKSPEILHLRTMSAWGFPKTIARIMGLSLP